MSDFITMQNRVALEVRMVSTAAAAGLVTEIKASITDAIKHYQLQAFWFNEQEAYNAIDETEDRYIALPSDFVRMYTLSCTAGASKWTLEQRGLDWIEENYDAGERGRPEFYTIFNKQLMLAPMPNGNYTLRLYYLKAYPLPAADTDTNPWLTDAEDMVRQRAKMFLCQNYLAEPDRAMQFAVLAKEAERQQTTHSRALLNLGTIEPVQF